MSNEDNKHDWQKDFNEAMRIIHNKKDEPLNFDELSFLMNLKKGKALLSKSFPTFPIDPAKINTNGFKSIQITAHGNCEFFLIVHGTALEGKRISFIPDSSGNVKELRGFPLQGMFYFEINMTVATNMSKIEIEFELH